MLKKRGNNRFNISRGLTISSDILILILNEYFKAPGLVSHGSKSTMI